MTINVDLECSPHAMRHVPVEQQHAAFVAIAAGFATAALTAFAVSMRELGDAAERADMHLRAGVPASTWGGALLRVGVGFNGPPPLSADGHAYHRRQLNRRGRSRR